MTALPLPPGYLRQPWSAERRAQASEAAARRLGSKPGMRRLFGISITRGLADAIRTKAIAVRKQYGLVKARQFIRRARDLYQEFT